MSGLEENASVSGEGNQAILAALQTNATEQMDTGDETNQQQQGQVVQQQAVHVGPGGNISLVYMPQGSQQPQTQPFLAPSTSARMSGLPLLNREAPFDANKELHEFWPKQRKKIEELGQQELRDATKTQQLPLARIKKIMKLDDDVKGQMISAETPVLFAKAAEIFIEELTLRSWVHTEDNKRRTLQKSDIAMAISKFEQFDFLIDIVPRDEAMQKSQLSKPSRTAPDPLMIDERATPARNQNDLVVSTPGGETLQYFMQTTPTGELQQTTGQMGIQLQNGQMVQALPIGDPIPLQATNANQTLQVIQLGNDASGQPIQLQLVAPNQQGQQTVETQQNE